MLLNYITWDVNPEIFRIGAVAVRWYGLFWAIGIYATLLITTKIFKHEKLPEAWVDKLFIYTVLGAILGARLGHCLFYEWKLVAEPISFLGITFNYENHYLSHPWELLFVWRGGLASHGGAIGILIAMILFNKNVSKKGINWIFDRLLIGVCLCGAAIRFGNLMNSEIYGDATSLPWGFIFVRTGETQPMHPTQIYEMIYCLVTFAIMWFMYWKKEAYKKNGLLFGIFLIGVFGSRFMLEFIKNNQEAFESGLPLNMGQWLSIPFIVWGIWLLLRNSSVPKSA
ncbi:MAG: prolipoprotein diacylglyceryl transferase [Paludibacter sp.]|nr:prolipoprotein diacylglyceryl transferase [Paludibacter sp.]MBP7611681.1 prolipoprotein diacylglyceryl transferase [Paludibacter sp.]MBV5283709.1 prolipoprotein diacylglyceryl transferase [Paludibacter sp.]